MRAFGRDLIRGGHYGQRSCEPHEKAEHMAAPTNAAKREESSCQLGAVHTWRKGAHTEQHRRNRAAPDRPHAINLSIASIPRSLRRNDHWLFRQ
jgi:hypothetical protein